jgi:NDP-mannose synthase
MHAIVLAGGKGTRLLPHTRHRPKALIRLGRCPILEIILRRLRASGFDRVTLCVSHLGEMIRAEFGDGRRLGLAIDYCVDERPLGTAAPLLLVEDWTTPAVVMNGDILTAIDLAGLHRTHRRSGARLTVAFHRRSLTSPMGLLQMRGASVTAVWEKPTFEWNVSCGIYVVDPLVRRHIPRGVPADMPGLISTLVERGEPVRGHRFSAPWHDIGSPASYERAHLAYLADPDLYLDPRAPAPVPPDDRGELVGELALDGDERQRGLDIFLLDAVRREGTGGSWT